MASTDAKPVPQKGVAFRVTFPVLDADGDLVTGATSPDSEVSKDGGAFADCTNEATEIATASGVYYLDLTSTEMTADTVAVIVKSGNGKTTTIVMYPEEAGDIRVNATTLGGDTGALNWLKQTYASGFADTGLNDRLGRIGFDVDTGLRAHVSDVDTGLHAILALADTGKIATAVWAGDTGLRDHITNIDTGLTNMVNVAGVVVRAISDTGINDRLGKILADTDTGLKDEIATLDTGLRALISSSGSGNITAIAGDTGAASRLQKFAGLQLKTDGTLDTGTGQTTNTLNISAPVAAVDTGAIVNGVWNALRSEHTAAGSFGESDTGINNRLAVIAADTDTGIQSSVNVTAIADTGVNGRLAAIQTKTDSLTFTQAGHVDSNVQRVNDVAVGGTGASGDEWGPA
jgi:hypothetical protein